MSRWQGIGFLLVRRPVSPIAGLKRADWATCATCCCVRRPVSPIAGLKPSMALAQAVINFTRQKACKPDRGIETNQLLTRAFIEMESEGL